MRQSPLKIWANLSGQLCLALTAVLFCSCQGMPQSRYLEQRLRSSKESPPSLLPPVIDARTIPSAAGRPFNQQPTTASPNLPPEVDSKVQLPPVLSGPQGTPLPSPAPLPTLVPAPTSPPSLARLPHSNILPPVPGMEPRFPALPPEAQQPVPQLAARPAHQGELPDCPPFEFATPAPYYCDDCNFVPPGIARPWPYDEYIWNGCDINEDVQVRKDWSVVGLDLQDTVAHYDTIAGTTEVTRANCVPIYAPRFAATRKVVDLVHYDAAEMVTEQTQPLHPILQQADLVVTTAIQPVAPIDKGTIRGLEVFKEQNPGHVLEKARLPFLAQRDFLPHEDLLIIRMGEFRADEKLRLAERTENAIVWTKDVAAQVILDGDLPAEAKNPLSPQGIFVYDRGGKPCVRILKIANKSEALPGEIVDFTLRFDNIGDQTVGNVTILDNLVSRLDYVPDSQECSLPANFSATRNEGDSLTLRWELIDPLPQMQGGIIRFQCRVR